MVGRQAEWQWMQSWFGMDPKQVGSPTTPQVLLDLFLSDGGIEMTVEEATDYHRSQVEIFRDADADLVTAIAMNDVEEAIGITRAAQTAEMPVVTAFTVETDGQLPTGQSSQDAIAQVDAVTGNAPATRSIVPIRSILLIYY
jgi:S-methylmethionine-dependent homocysteine/selenocysteine methylase